MTVINMSNGILGQIIFSIHFTLRCQLYVKKLASCTPHNMYVMQIFSLFSSIRDQISTNSEEDQYFLEENVDHFVMKAVLAHTDHFQ